MKKIDQKERQRITMERQAERMAILKERLPPSAYEKLERVSPKYIGRLSKALAGTKSKKTMIAAMCEQCVGWEHTVEQIGNCSAYICALHPYRPHQGAADK